MVEIYPLVFSKADLSGVPKEEILFHMVFAQLANEIQILRKQVMLASNSIGEAGPKADAGVAAAHVNLRLLAGRLYEGHRLLQDKPAGSIHQAYVGELEPEARKAHRSIMQYFGQGSTLIKHLRNKASFHWDHESIAQAYDEIPDDLQLTDYIAWECGNCLYYSGALLSVGQMTAIAGLNDAGTALDRIFEEVSDVASWFEYYAQGFMFAFAKRHLSLSKEKFDAVRQAIDGCPDIQAASLPYFMDTDSVQHLRDRQTSLP